MLSHGLSLVYPHVSAMAINIVVSQGYVTCFVIDFNMSTEGLGQVQTFQTCLLTRVLVRFLRYCCFPVDKKKWRQQRHGDARDNAREYVLLLVTFPLTRERKLKV